MAEYAQKKKTTRRERFFKGERRRKPIGLDRMLRMHFLQQWYALADEALEDGLYHNQAMRSLAGINLGTDPAPDSATLLKFRHLLERHALT